MLARLAVLCLALVSAASAATTRDKPRSSDDMKNIDLITEYGNNAELPPDRWSCARPAKPASGRAAGKEATTPLQRAADLKCLTEWLWSVQRYFAAGGKSRKGLEPEFVASERKRAVALAEELSRWAAQVAAPPTGSR